MIRALSIALALVASAATAGEPIDCYNDETDTNTRYTSIEPEVLRVTDADILTMLVRAREHDKPSVVRAASGSTLHLSLNNEKPASP